LLGVDSLTKSENTPLLLIETLEDPCAVAVEEILKTEEIVIKPLGNLLNNPAAVGAAILGDGSVVPVLDLIYLLNQRVQSSKLKAQSPQESMKNLLEEQSKIQNLKSKIVNIMIVDDSPSVRQVNSKLIKNAGMQAIIAKDGLEALEMLQTSEKLPDVILTDVEMPRMDGYELLASLKKTENLRDVPVIMITSRTSDKHRQKALDLGVSEYLTKPYEDTKLLGIIKSLSEHQGTNL
jgi:chemosensory pili system protein ChpA (sensor histidine kinase/response regulator)